VFAQVVHLVSRFTVEFLAILNSLFTWNETLSTDYSLVVNLTGAV